eukprot:1321590-Rhodomonas_salina.3
MPCPVCDVRYEHTHGIRCVPAPTRAMSNAGVEVCVCTHQTCWRGAVRVCVKGASYPDIDTRVHAHRRAHGHAGAGRGGVEDAKGSRRDHHGLRPQGSGSRTACVCVGGLSGLRLVFGVWGFVLLFVVVVVVDDGGRPDHHGLRPRACAPR